MTIVRFNDAYQAFQPGEIGGVANDVARMLISRGHADLYDPDDVPSITGPPAASPTDEDMVVVEFLSGYGAFQPGEIGAVFRSTAEQLFELDPITGQPAARLHGDGVPGAGRGDAGLADGDAGLADGDAASAGGPEVRTPRFDPVAKAAMQDSDQYLVDKLFVALEAAGITSAAGIINKGTAGLQVDVDHVGKKTSERLVVAAEAYLQSQGVGV